MRFRWTKKQLEEFSDACFVEAVLTARKYELNPYGPLARRIDRTIARVHGWHSDPDEVKAAAEEQGLREFVFGYRKGEITVSVMAYDEEEAREKLRKMPDGTAAGPLGVEVEFGRLWQEYWQLLGLERRSEVAKKTGNEVVVALTENEFAEKVAPKKVTSPDELFLFKCSQCDNVHFRHAGYLETLMPFIRADGDKTVSKTSYAVHVCTKCRACFIWLNEQMYEVTDLLDLEAWVKLEREIHFATGPGGNC